MSEDKQGCWNCHESYRPNETAPMCCDAMKRWHEEQHNDMHWPVRKDQYEEGCEWWCPEN